MPELPEVETVRRTLTPLLKNNKIVNVKIFWPKMIKEPQLALFKNLLINQSFIDIKRKAKLLIFEFADYVLLSHLRMEGKYYFQPKTTIMNKKHILLVLEMENGYELRYHDTRRFGTFHLQKKDNYQLQKPYINLGPEANDLAVTTSYLQKKWCKKKQKIKTALLDQSIVSGLGNIYSDEVLFRSQIHPATIVNTLKEQQLLKIILNARIVLNEAIKYKGTTIASYTSNLGVRGNFQTQLQVHRRLNQNCYRCSDKISKIKINGRSTYFCPNCQK